MICEPQKRKSVGRPKKVESNQNNITKFRLPELNKPLEIRPRSVLGNTKLIKQRGVFIREYPSVLLFRKEGSFSSECYIKTDLQIGLYRVNYL